MAIIDTHAHLGPWPTPVTPLDAGTLDRLMKQFGITRCCVSSSVAALGDLAAGNQALAEAIEGSATLLGYCVINPNFLDLSAEEMARYLGDGGFAATCQDLFARQFDVIRGQAPVLETYAPP
jgi:hypothetical protein